jgi:hypothetical protein
MSTRKDDKFHLDISSIQRPALRRSKCLIIKEEEEEKDVNRSIYT